MDPMTDSPALSELADDAATAAAIDRVGAIDRDLQKIEAGKAKRVADASREAEEKAGPLVTERNDLVARIRAYAETHRRRLTDGFKRKTAPFTTGECEWRLGSGRVVVDDDPTLKSKIFEKLRKLGGFIRTKEEIDRAAIGRALRADPKAPVGKVPGISLEPATESFTVKPVSAELTERP